jgi:hypothetical protein
MHRFLVSLCGLAALASVTLADDGAQAAAVLQKRAPSIVTVKIVLKTEIQVMGQQQDQEERIQLQGAVVDPSGLVMFSNASISAAKLQEALSGMMEERGQGGGLDIKTTPSDIKVVFGNEEQEYAAFLAATDARLDLAFVQVQNLGEKKLEVVDFPEAATPTIGQSLVAVSRLNEGYDYAAFFETAHVVGEIKKPIPAFIVAGEASGVGLPVFSATGEALGVLTVLASGMKPQGGGGLMMMMGGAGDAMESAFRAFVVPAKQVKAVIAQAKTRAAEAAKEAQNQPAPPTTTEGGAPPKTTEGGGQ